MPVLSPHRSSALTGSYRTTSSAIDRPYFTTSSYNPRITSYSERYRSYTDSDGRRVFSRSGSITEDGITHRYREESRESSLNRNDYRRESSLGRDRLTPTHVIDSVAELRNRYSPANYVPACQRDRDHLTRSKSINDIGLPPSITKRPNCKVNETNSNQSVAYHSNDNHLMLDLTDNNNRASVADLRKKFDRLKNDEMQNGGGGVVSNVTGGLNSKFDVKIEPKVGTSKVNGFVPVVNSRINHFASYIPCTKDERKDNDREEVAAIDEDVLVEDGGSKLATPPRASPPAGPSLKRADYAPPPKQLGLNGLKNIGNTCFMNSVIQCLSNTRQLLEYLTRDAYVADINASTSSMKGALIRAFVEVVRELWSEEAADRVVNTATLKGQIQRFAPRFIGYAQQDAQEFLRYLLEGLHEDVNRVRERPKPILTEIDERLSDSEKSQESWNRYLRIDNSRIVDCFVGQLKSTLKCTHCGHCSVTFDPFWDLSLPIPQRAGQVRLAQCLESFTREETLDGDEKPTCSKCKERRRCTKSFSIQKFPKILVIHLKRFSLAERFRGKLNVTVDFPLEGLDLSHYAADQGIACRYNLYAISNHSGTTYSGHYTAYCRHPYSKTWHEYNDSRVSSISPKSIVSGEAYVLFYEQDGQKSHL